MFNLSSVKVGPIPKVLLIHAFWGIALLIAGLLQQYAKLSFPDGVFLVWGVATVVGLLGQAIGLCKGLVSNFIVWVVLIVIAWAFTIYALRIDSSFSVAAEVAPVWLGLMGIGFIATALQVDKMFWIVAILHIVVAVLVELAGRNILKVDFLVSNSPLIVGVVMGGSMILAGIIGTAQALGNKTATATAQY
jgi:hypothetical protein